MKRFNRFALAILLAAPCIYGQLAYADTNSEAPREVTVKFADLDLAHAQGVAALYRRLHAAARHVCDPLDERPLERAQLFKACVAGALASAVAGIHEPLLSSYQPAGLGTPALEPSGQ